MNILSKAWLIYLIKTQTIAFPALKKMKGESSFWCLSHKALQAKRTPSAERKERSRKGHHAEKEKAEAAKKGVAPAFVFGLEDMDLHVGERAAVAGKLAKRMRFF